jgi:hypothetical protein
MSSLPHAEETDVPMVHFFCLVVEIEVHPKDTSSGLVRSARYLRGPLERERERLVSTKQLHLREPTSTLLEAIVSCILNIVDPTIPGSVSAPVGYQ